jgi:hypothetical protein
LITYLDDNQVIQVGYYIFEITHLLWELWELGGGGEHPHSEGVTLVHMDTSSSLGSGKTISTSWKSVSENAFICLFI